MNDRITPKERSIEEGLDEIESILDGMNIQFLPKSTIMMIVTRMLNEDPLTLESIKHEITKLTPDGFIQKYRVKSSNPVEDKQSPKDDPSNSVRPRTTPAATTEQRPMMRRTTSTTSLPAVAQPEIAAPVSSAGNIQTLRDKIKAMKDSVSSFGEPNVPTQINQTSGDEGDRQSYAPPIARAKKINEIFGEAGGITRDQMETRPDLEEFKK